MKITDPSCHFLLANKSSMEDRWRVNSSLATSCSFAGMTVEVVWNRTCRFQIQEPDFHYDQHLLGIVIDKVDRQLGKDEVSNFTKSMQDVGSERL